MFRFFKKKKQEQKEGFENITLLEYLQLKDNSEYNVLFGSLKPKNKLGVFESKFNKLTFAEMNYLKKNISKIHDENVFFNIFELVFSVNKDQLLAQKIIDFIAATNYINKSIENIFEAEKKALSGEEDEDFILAGGLMLNSLGNLPTLITIGMKFGKSPEEVANWSYKTVFGIQRYFKMSAEIDKNLRESHRLKMQMKNNKAL